MPGATGGCFFALGVGPSERVVSTNWTPGRPPEGGRALGQGCCRARFRISSSCFVASMDEYGFSCLQKLLLLFCETNLANPQFDCWEGAPLDGEQDLEMAEAPATCCRWCLAVSGRSLPHDPCLKSQTRDFMPLQLHMSFDIWSFESTNQEIACWQYTPRSEKPCGGRLTSILGWFLFMVNQDALVSHFEVAIVAMANVPSPRWLVPWVSGLNHEEYGNNHQI